VHAKYVLYYKLWWNNIGNAFIDLGTLYILRKIFSKESIHSLSGFYVDLIRMQHDLTRISRRKRIATVFPVTIRNILKKISKLKGKELYLSYNYISPRNTFEILEEIKNAPMYIVLAGAILDKFILQIIYPRIKNLLRHSHVILLGVSGSSYSDPEINYATKVLKEIKPYILISRDKLTYDYFSNLAEYSYNGIDSSFYLPDLYKPLKLANTKYVVIVSDIGEENREFYIKCKDCKKIYSIHSLKAHLSYDIIKKLLLKKNMFFSDNPYDYITLYSNAKEVHSLRIHACVVALAYGTPCRYYGSELRAKLFENIGANPSKELTTVNHSYLKKLKENQLRFLKEVISRR